MILGISNFEPVLLHSNPNRYANNQEKNHNNPFKGKNGMTKYEDK